MSPGIFVEGKSDKDAIPKLIRKILDPSPKIIPRTIPRDEMFNSESLRPYLEALLKKHHDIEKVIVCVDSECTDPEEIWEKASRVERELNEIGLPVRYAMVVHTLEGWLAADPKALEQVLGRGAKLHIKRNLEEVCKPAELLGDLFARYGKDFQKPRYDPQIAEYARPKEIAKRNQSFRRFCQLIKDP